MRRDTRIAVAAMATALALASGSTWSGTIFEAQPLRDGSSTSEAASSSNVVPGSAFLTTAERAAISPNSDGTVTHRQYMNGMENRWHAMEKNGAGNLPAARLAAPQTSEDKGAPWSTTPY